MILFKIEMKFSYSKFFDALFLKLKMPYSKTVID